MATHYENVHVIINPASGQNEPILNVIDEVMHEHEVPWQAQVTQEPGDATTMTKEAVAQGADLVVCYGGDGTLMEVINGLIDVDVPVGILPGGTGNAVAIELNIPAELRQAVEVAVTSDNLRRMDLGRVDDRYFIMRVFTGIGEDQVATREMKDKYGLLAYPISAFKFLEGMEEVDYRLEIDGKSVTAKAVLCYVDNVGSIGGMRSSEVIEPITADIRAITGRESAKADVDPWDGLLDVILLSSEANKIMAMASYLLNIGQNEQHVDCWQVKRVRIDADPPQPVRLDGETFGETPVEIEVVPSAVTVVLPQERPDEG